MASTYEDTVLDFDLNFLNQTTTNTFQEPDAETKIERLRRSVIFLKKKVLFSHKAVTRYKAARKYAQILENNQVYNKEGCKQHLIEIRNLIEKVARLENECREVDTREKQKTELIYDLQNKLEALQAHEKQLKLLIKEKSKEECVRVEKTKDKANFIDRQRKGLLQKENDYLNKENERLKKEIETLRKENNKILHLEKENESETVCKDNSKILSMEKEIENLRKEIDDANNLKKVNENLRKENARIPILDKENETLRKETAKIPKLEKENKTLRQERAKIENLEKEIETLHIENAKIANLETVNKTLQKENTKIQTLEKEIEMLNKHLTLVKNEKSKLFTNCDQLLSKHESLPDGNDEWCNNTDTESDVCEDTFLSPAVADPVMVKESQIAAQDMVPIEFENDNSNEVVNIDTGRDSSLANSDNEKYNTTIHSPDYFANINILNEENTRNKDKSDLLSMSKSTTVFEHTIETATHPIVVYIEQEDSSDTESLAIREISPKLSTPERSVSPIKETNEIASVPVIVFENTPLQPVQDVQVKECLEVNNNINMQYESSTDKEIEKILCRMQLNYTAVSPIPRTPTTLQLMESATGLSEDSNILKLLGRIEILGDEITDLKKALSEEIEERLRKSNRPSTPSINVSGTSQFDSDHQHNIINDVSNVQPECVVRTQSLLIEDSVVIQPNVQILGTKRPRRRSSRLSRETDISQIDQPENNSYLPKLHDQSLKQMPGSEYYVSEEPTTENSSEYYVSEELTTDNSNKTGKELSLSSTEDATNAKKCKRKKITKLEKLKKKFGPKYKIRRDSPPLKSRIKPKQLAVIKKKVTVSDSAASLNDKNVYENAVKVMAEINSQQNNKVAKSPIKRIKPPLSPKSPKSSKSTSNLETLNNTINSNQMLSQNDQNNKVAKSPIKHIKVPLSPKSPKATTNLENLNNTNNSNQTLSQNDPMTSPSKRKSIEQPECCVVLTKEPLVKLAASLIDTSVTPKDKDDIVTLDEQPPRKRRRQSVNKPEIQCKRILRSSTVQLRLSTENSTELSDENGETNRKSIECHNVSQIQQIDNEHDNIITYDDLNMFSEGNGTPSRNKETNNQSIYHPKESILCTMIEKYGVEIIRPFAKKVSDVKVKLVCDKLEQDIAKIIEVPTHETKNAMNTLVADLRKLNYKHFVTGLIKYLTKPERKTELFGKISSPPAPPMTKAEQVLLYVISHLKTHWPSVDIVDAVLSNIEYTLFRLNRTPEFDVIESTSHFYALLCRYFGAKSRLRLFILDAMYCIQFKSVPLIKQCLDVWMHIIPLAHMGMAKSPLVTCLVYLLHFYKCDDKFNRIQDIRNILNRKYFYQITDWNEKKILEMFKVTIMELKDIPIERKMLRLALIILAKRQGPRWCQNNIIKNLLQPIIEKETVPNNVKEFCVSMFGPLMRPYPVDMKVHCEIVINQLTDILNNDPSPQMEEAAITSMMFINRHDQLGINQTLLSRKMKTMSPELEKLIRDYVRTKPLKMWKKTLSKINRF